MKGNNKNVGGRPTKYKTEFNTQVYKLCLLGATDNELADFLEVNVDTIHEWKKNKPGFSDALKRGKLQADSVVAEKLFKRATGYSHADEQIFIYYGKPVRVKTTKHYPPDTTAAIFWLKNRRKDEWRDKQNIEIDFDNITDEELDRIIDKMIPKIK